jgi:hypothetical protein
MKICRRTLNGKGVFQMRKSRFFVLGILALIFGVVFTGCSKKNNVSSTGISSEVAVNKNENVSKIPSELVGKWYRQSDKTEFVVFEFTADGKYVSGITSFDISVSDKKITANYLDEMVGTLDYSITDGVLTITDATDYFTVLQYGDSNYKKK